MLEVNNLKVGGNELGKWEAPPLSLGEGATSGVSIFRAFGGGLQYSFDSTSDDEWSVDKPLVNLGILYDGSDLQIEISYQLSSNGGVGDNVKLDTEYQIVNDGDDTDGAGTTINDTIDVSAQVSGQVYSYTLGTNLTGGTANDKELLMSILRNSTGAGADTFGGSIWFVGIKIIKV